MTVPALLERLRLQNPVLAKDLRTRMRGQKAFVVQGLYVGALALTMGFWYMTWWLSHQYGASPVAVATGLGRQLYLTIFEVQAALVALIAPALSAGTITLEHEQRTYELLACTRLNPRTILVGKLMSGWLYVVMLLTCSLPLAALCLMLGGVSGLEIVCTYVMLCLFALFFCSIGVVASATFSRSMQAMPLAYGAVGFYVIATAFGGPFPGRGALWGLNPFLLVFNSTEKMQLFGLTPPGWVAPLVVLPLAVLLFVNWGIQRLPHFAADRGLAIRALTASLFASLAVLGLAHGHSFGSPTSASFAVALVGMAAVLPLAAAFVTGYRPHPPPRSLLSWMFSGLHPRRIFSNELRGAWAFVLLLAALLSAVLWLGAHLPASVAIVRAFVLATAYPPGATSAAATIASPMPAAIVVPVLCLLASVLILYSALGILGAAFDSRALGAAPIIILYTANYLVMAFIWTGYQGASGLSSPDAWILLAAPFVALITLSGQAPSALSGLPWAGDLWIFTAIIHLVAAAAALLFAEIVHQAYLRRSRALQESAGQALQSEQAGG